MMLLTLLLFLSGLTSVDLVKETPIKELSAELDKTVLNRSYYMERKEARIDSLRQMLNTGLSLDDEFTINHKIYEEYSTYKCDSAMVYVLRNKEIGEQLNKQIYKDASTIALSFLLSTTGIFRESIDNLNGLNRTNLDPPLLEDYFSVSEWTYYTAAAYTDDEMFAPVYRQLEHLYRDSLFNILPEGSNQYTYYVSKKLNHQGKVAEGLDNLLALFPRLSIDTRLYAIVTYEIAFMYKALGDMEMHEKFLILAAISDQVCPLKENLAMQELALFLYTHKPEELNRAYRYIQYSMEDARFYNNRLRALQISQKLPIIVDAYQKKSQQENNRLTGLSILLGVLSLLTLISLLYVYRQMKTARRNRQELSSLNKVLSILNTKLQDANQTKEEYVGLFMDLCSSYIDKLDKYRLTVKRKITANQIDELYKLTSSSRGIETELDDFFHNFDMAFLHLYPTFVDEFSALFEEKDRIRLKKGELLNTELRIFALIRLGINDSSKIALFLRYSPQTIYNYRTRVKKRTIIDRDDFEKEILKIGK